MLICLFDSTAIRTRYAVTFSYRKNRAYERGFAARIQVPPVVFPLILPTSDGPFSGGGVLRRSARFVARVAARAAQLRAICFAYDVSRLTLLFKRVRPEVLHVNNGGFPGALSCLAAVVAGRLARVPARLMTVNNLAVRYDRLSRYLDWPIDQLAIRSTTAFLTGSRAAGLRLQEVLGIKASRIFTIPNTVIERPLTEGREATRRRLGLSVEDVVIGTVAVLERRKGIHVLIDALQLLRERFEGLGGIRVVIEGIGSEKDRLVRAVHAGDLGAHVVFVEREARILDLMEAFDIFVLPSIADEDFPNVVLEAMSLGKPIVGSNLAGIAEQVTHGVNGLLVPPEDAYELADALGRLLRDETLRSRMGLESRAGFTAHFAYERVIPKYLELYERLLPGGARVDRGDWPELMVEARDPKNTGVASDRG